MAIISQETWDNMPIEEKEKIISDYQEYARLCEEGIDEFDRNDNYSRKSELEQLVGKENLQPKPKTPKVWGDMEALHEEIDTAFVELEESLCNIDCKTKLFNKILATYQIQHLIEFGYGGMVTEEEWKDGNVEKASIVYLPYKKNFDLLYNSHRKEFITFHSKRQAEEFMSYPENRALAEQYYLCGNN